jgi:hypothetical protein
MELATKGDARKPLAAIVLTVTAVRRLMNDPVVMVGVVHAWATEPTKRRASVRNIIDGMIGYITPTHYGDVVLILDMSS